MTLAHNYVITSRLLNEFRGGFNAQHTSTNQSYSTSQLLSETGLIVPQPDLAWSEALQVIINGFMATGGGNPTVQRSQIVQILDNVTWTKQHHTLKFGGDFKRLTDYDTNVFGNYISGWYVFGGSPQVGTNIGDPYTAFLQGYPDYTEDSTVNKPEMNGLGYSYAVFAQDDWKITPNLTLNLGLRYELHPPLKETSYNTAFFLPDYSGVGTDGSHVTGAVVVPNSTAIGFESQDFISAISPTPTFTAKQASLPQTLRYTDRNDWGPRIGFAWRPYGNDKTVVRGGWGRFTETPLGFSLVSGWAVSASYVGVYNQAFESDGVTPQLSFSNPFPPQTPGSAAGTAGFYYAFPTHYKHPSVQEWNLTVEQDLGKGIGLRLSTPVTMGSTLKPWSISTRWRRTLSATTTMRARQSVEMNASPMAATPLPIIAVILAGALSRALKIWPRAITIAALWKFRVTAANRLLSTPAICLLATFPTRPALLPTAL